MPRNSVGFRVRAQLRVDQLEGLGDMPRRVRMDRKTIAVATQNSRMRLTGSRAKTSARNRDTAILNFEIARCDDLPLAPERRKPGEPRGRLGLPFFERCADDRGSDRRHPCDQKIMLHEPLDAGETAPRRIAEPARKPALVSKLSLSSALPVKKMQMAAHPPKKLLATAATAYIGTGKPPAPTRSAASRSR